MELLIGMLIFTVCWIGLALIFKRLGFMEDERELLKEHRERLFSKQIGAYVEHRITGVQATCDEDMLDDDNWELA